MDLKQFQKLKDLVERDQRKADKASGVLESLLSRLQKEFKIKTLEEALKLKEELERKLKKLELDYDREFGEILTKYPKLKEEND